MTYVIYKNHCDEAIVCVLEDEHKVIEDYFTNGGRDLDDYDREVTNSPVQISASVSTR